MKVNRVLKSAIILQLLFVLFTKCQPLRKIRNANISHHKRLSGEKLDALQLRTDITKKLRTLTSKHSFARDAQVHLEDIRKQLQELVQRRMTLKPRVAQDLKKLEKRKRLHKLKKDVNRVMSRTSILRESPSENGEATSEKPIVVEPENLYT
ncbi:hypothetical protein RI129_012755 [Pyrocoelia pectoralis]|uniref:Uncharacterized protein n=1 Tax=Pyrocoelia pectoralis TaxID=417401 RepID=A0AAN7UU96_9COLE